MKLFLAALVLFPAFAQAEVHYVSRKVDEINLSTDCRIKRAKEPRGDLTYRVMTIDGAKIVTRPIYSDLCSSPTAQFITKIIYSFENEAKSPVIAMVGGNEDREEVSFLRFSEHVMR